MDPVNPHTIMVEYRKKIGEHISFITLLAVWSAIMVYTFTRIPPGQMGAGQVLFYILTVATGSIAFSLIPAIAVVYGWFTGRKAGAVLIGAGLLPAIYILAFIVIFRDNMVFIHVTGTILFLSVLSGISGLAGYCAALRTNRCLAVAIALVGLWVFFAMSGLN